MRLAKLVSVFLIIYSSFAPTVAAAATEAISGLPLFPGAKVSDAPQSQQHCGITMRSVQYRGDGPKTKPVEFFRGMLPGASTWTVANGYVTAFLSSNGKSIVKVIGASPNSYTIVYGSYSKPLSVSQVRSGTC
jgi:hypothetical protein